MANDLEQLPQLIQRAAAALAKATTAGEILEARNHADVAYSAAKKAAQFAKTKDAHDAVVAACRKVMADALVIEAQAQCRLADEYDAAQQRGEVKGHGNKRKSDIPKENITSTVTDIGLTSKQVHEARAVRDAEIKKPGIVRKAVEERLQANEEPTRADVKRAVKPAVKKSGPRAQRTGDEERELRNEKIIALYFDKGVSPREIAAEFGLVERGIHIILDREKARRKGQTTLVITRDDLSKTAQEKFDVAIRQHKRKLELSFDLAVREESRKWLDEMGLPLWKERIEEAKKLYGARRGLMDKATFNAIRRGLHPDSRNSISDAVLAAAFDKFMALEKYLLNETDSPTMLGNVPSSLAEWDKMRMKRPARRANSRSAVRPR